MALNFNISVSYSFFYGLLHQVVVKIAINQIFGQFDTGRVKGALDVFQIMPEDIVTADKLRPAQKLYEVRSGIGVKGLPSLLTPPMSRIFPLLGSISVSMKTIKFTVLSSFTMV